MKKITFLRNLIVLVALIVGSGSAMGQLLVEDFNYPIGTVITSTSTADPTTGWLAHSGNGTANIDVTNGLTFEGYAGSGIGGAANLDATGQDINKPFALQSSGAVYAAFIIQTQATNSAGYFIHLGPATMSSAFYSRVWVNASGSGVGISGSSAPASYVAITPSTPTLLVVKYDFSAGVSSLYVLNAFSATEPESANSTFAETIASIGTIGLRQYSASQRIIVDGIRVATSWAQAVAPASTTVATPTFSPEAGSYTTSQNISISTATADATVYYTTNGDTPTEASSVYSDPFTISTTTTVKARAFKSGMTASDVATAEYIITQTPTIQITEESIPTMSTNVGSTDTETITVNASNLTGNITLAVTGDDADLFTLSTYTLAHSSGSVSNQSVTITYTPDAPATSHTATLTLSSPGAENVVKELSGTATLAKPTATDATGISPSGFSANWDAVPGATSYKLDVYKKVENLDYASDLFFSEYIEGSSNNKALEIYNGTSSSVDLSTYTVETYTNGNSTAGYTLSLSGTLLRNDVYVVYNAGASSAIQSVGDITSNVTFYNGNDAVVLKNNGVIVDIIGKIGEDPGSAWTADGGYSTAEKTLVRKSNISGGVTQNPLSGFPTLATEWDLYNQDVTTYLGSHTYDGLAISITPVSGSPFTVTGETSKAITGLTASTQYFYTVKAINGSFESLVSEEETVTTSFGTSTDNPSSLTNIYAHNANIHFTATAGERVEVYNAVGQKIISTLAADGQNELPVSAKGVMIVKVGSRLAKVIL